MSWEDLQQEVHESVCPVIGHYWIGDHFKWPPDSEGGGEREAIGWKCLRCDLTTGEREDQRA